MADSSLRRSSRLVLASALAATLVVGAVPFAVSARVPRTVVRAETIRAAALMRQAAAPGLALAGDGTLRAVTAARTATTRVCAPIWFTALALTWRQDGSGVVSARIHLEGRSADLDAEGGPDPGSTEALSDRQGTNLLWTGGGRCLRLSLGLPAGADLADLRVLFINSSGTAAGPGTGPANVGPAPLGLDGGPDLPAAQAMTRTPRLVTREEWGADPSLMNCTPSMATEVRMGFVHHTAGANAYRPEESDDIVRAIYAYHTNGRGWCDIAYNFLIDRYGTVFEGRSGGPTLPVIGAATQGFNTGSFSVSLLGNFDRAAPTTAAVRSLRRVLAWRLDVAHLPPRGRAAMVSGGGSNTRYAAGTDVTLRVVSGHRDTGYTDCPGAELYDILDRIRRDVSRLGLPKMYRPTLSSPTIVPGVPIHLTSRGTEALTWSVVVLDAAGEQVAVLPTQTGERLDLTWSGTGNPFPTEPGAYQVVVAGQASDGRVARQAVLPLSVPPPFSPTPGPSASPSVSPSASPTPTASPSA